MPVLACLIMVLMAFASESPPQKAAAVLSPSPAEEAESEVVSREKVYNFPLRTLKRLRIGNVRGRVLLKGWAQEKIRVRAVFQVEGKKDEIEAQFKSMDVELRDRPGEWELVAKYGKGLSIREKQVERHELSASGDLEIMAPGRLQVEIEHLDQPVELEGWNGEAGIYGPGGQVFLRNIDSPKVSVNCPDCTTTVTKFKGELTITGGEGSVHLENVEGSKLFIHTTSGDVTGNRIKGSLVCDLGDGNLKLDGVEGSVHYQTGGGTVEINDLKGSLSGRTESGALRVFAKKWISGPRNFIESDSGNIELNIAETEGIELESKSALGSVTLEPSDRLADLFNTKGRLRSHRLEPLRVHTQAGSIKVKVWN